MRRGPVRELVAAATIGAADYMGLPVSTTHVYDIGHGLYDGHEIARACNGRRSSIC